MKKYEEYEIKWWKDWLEADFIKRKRMVEKLPIINEISNMDKIPINIRKHSFAMLFNSFFEDLESAIYTKIRIENKKVAKKK